MKLIIEFALNMDLKHQDVNYMRDRLDNSDSIDEDDYSDYDGYYSDYDGYYDEDDDDEEVIDNHQKVLERRVGEAEHPGKTCKRSGCGNLVCEVTVGKGSRWGSLCRKHQDKNVESGRKSRGLQTGGTDNRQLALDNELGTRKHPGTICNRSGCTQLVQERTNGAAKSFGTRCAVHAENKRQCNDKQREQWKLLGLCTRCGHDRDDTSKLTCFSCRHYKRKSSEMDTGPQVKTEPVEQRQRVTEVVDTTSKTTTITDFFRPAPPTATQILNEKKSVLDKTGLRRYSKAEIRKAVMRNGGRLPMWLANILIESGQFTKLGLERMFPGN